jgi:hypothetical protein
VHVDKAGGRELRVVAWEQSGEFALVVVVPVLGRIVLGADVDYGVALG